MKKTCLVLTLSWALGAPLLGQVDQHWFPEAPPSSPPPLFTTGMTYSPVEDRSILFGGSTGGGAVGDTWAWDGDDWALAATDGPPPRWSAELVYVASTGKVLLFGGQGTLDYDDTWEWNGASWTELLPPAKPPGRWAHALVYDSARDRVVLFGGGAGPLPLNNGDTWEWDGQTWMQMLPANAPVARGGMAMAYDEARARVVLYGGASPASPISLHDDTWEWDGVDWTLVPTASAPPPRDFHRMVYDSARQRVVLWGGRTYGAALNDLWSWDGTAWTQLVQSNPPPPRWALATSFDSSRHRLVVFGGHEIGVTYGDTHEGVAPVLDLGGACGGGAPALAASPFALGQTWTFQASGFTPGALSALFASFAPVAPSPLGPCTVHLDVANPANLLLVAAGSFDPQGDWNVQLPGVSDPATAGISVALQALGLPTAGPMGVDLSNGILATIH